MPKKHGAKSSRSSGSTRVKSLAVKSLDDGPSKKVRGGDKAASSRKVQLGELQISKVVDKSSAL